MTLKKFLQYFSRILLPSAYLSDKILTKVKLLFAPSISNIVFTANEFGTYFVTVSIFGII